MEIALPQASRGMGRDQSPVAQTVSQLDQQAQLASLISPLHSLLGEPLRDPAPVAAHAR